MHVFRRTRIGQTVFGLVMGLLTLANACPAAATTNEAGAGLTGFGLCGALTVESGLVDPWPAGRGVRIGDTVATTDKGLGCRYTLPGRPAKQTRLEARLTRPLALGEGTAVDRWHLAARRGEPVAVVYSFYPPGRVVPGQWTLELFDGDTRLAVQAFTVTGSEVRGTATPPPASEPVAGAGDSEVPDRATRAAGSDKPGTPARPAPSEAPASQASQTARPTAAPPRTTAAKAAVKPEARPAQPPTGAVPDSGASAATGYYALQTGLFTDADNAAGQAIRLRGRGLPACVAAEGAGGTRRYRVLAGRYGEKRAALAARGEVRAATGITPLVFAVDARLSAGLRCH